MSSTKVARGHTPHILNVLFPLYAISQPFIYFFLNATCTKPLHQDYKKPKPKGTPTPTSTPRQMESIFIEALIQAASCRQHTRLPITKGSTPNPAFTYHKARRRHPQGAPRLTRKFHVSSRPAESLPGQAVISREECIDMVDYYDCYQKSCDASVLSMEIEQAPAIEPTPLVKGAHDQVFTQNLGDCTHKKSDGIGNLITVLRNEDASHEAIYEAYSALPSPQVSSLPDAIHRLLLRRLAVVEKRNKNAMLRYLSVMEDMKAADLPLIESEWNSAIAYTGLCFVRVQAAEVEAALRTWKEMEQEAGVQSGMVTFNILFDIAAKAGKYILAEMILKEMEARNLKMNRYARVGFIYYHGLKGDGQGVRLAYRDFIESGGIVDTVVMNCVIASLIRAGELSAAEQVYERMKQILSKKTGAAVPLMNWKGTRKLGRVLNRAATVHKDDPEKLQQIRNEQYLGPNLHTFAIFVEHHATQTGELRRIATLLDEMRMLGIPMHGRIFLKLFKGFAHHGGVRYTLWTKDRLESVWNSLLSVLGQEVPDVQVMTWMVVWVIKAFSKCCGRPRTMEIWEELRTKWKPDVSESKTVEHLLRDILRSQSDGEVRENENIDDS